MARTIKLNSVRVNRHPTCSIAPLLNRSAPLMLSPELNRIGKYSGYTAPYLIRRANIRSCGNWVRNFLQIVVDMLL
jgi:hypothetical protein